MSLKNTAVSKSVKIKTLYPYDNIMVIEKTYEYENGNTDKRPQTRLPSGFKKDWVYIGTEKDDYIKTPTGGFWTIKEIFIKDKHVYTLPKK